MMTAISRSLIRQSNFAIAKLDIMSISERRSKRIGENILALYTRCILYANAYVDETLMENLASLKVPP